LYEEVGSEGLTELIEKRIDPNPHGRGFDEAQTVERSVRVWAIIGELEVGKGDLQYAAESYRISVQSVRAALAYYWRYRSMIRGRMAANSGDPAPLVVEA
jgi:uncharacterized protein (DUF433 family)